MECYQPLDYDAIMLGKKILLAGYRGKLYPAIQALMIRHGAAVYESLWDDEPFTAAVMQQDVLNVAKRAGRIDSLVYIAPPVEPFSIEYTSDDSANRMYRAGCLGLHMAVQAVLPVMKERREGTVVAVTSDYAVSAIPYIAMYAANMAAMNAYVRGLSMECCKYGIRGNAVMAGFSVGDNADVYMAHHGTEDALDAFQRYSVLPRQGSCDDIANAVLFCASAMSNSITGEVIPVDGGTLAIGHSQVWNPKDKPAFSLSFKEGK